MVAVAPNGLDGSALDAWRSYLQSHASIVRELDDELSAEHGITARDYEVFLYLARAPDRKLGMSDLATNTRLTPSGITRLIDGLVDRRLIARVGCSSDARISYAHLTETGYERLRRPGGTRVEGIRWLFFEHLSREEIHWLAWLLSRLPGARPGGPCRVD